MNAARLVAAVRTAGVTDKRVLDAMRAVPRAGFVPAEYADQADNDEPIPIPYGQVTTQPSLSAQMIAALALDEAHHVLEVGTGYGYQTALLAKLAGFVTSIERLPALAGRARDNLAALGIANVRVLVGDGTQGVSEHAPYDAILVSAARPSVPPPLAEQLRVGGHLVQPIGPGGAEDVTLFRRTASGLEPVKLLTMARFVQLIGEKTD